MHTYSDAYIHVKGTTKTAAQGAAPNIRNEK